MIGASSSAMRACTLWAPSSCAASCTPSSERSEMAFSSALRLPPSRCATDCTLAKASLSPPPRPTCSNKAVSSPLFWLIAAPIDFCSASLSALTKRAAASEICPEITDRRMASIIAGTCRLVTYCTPRPAVEKDTMATVAAMMVIAAAAPKASCSLPPMPSLRRAKPGSVARKASAREPAEMAVRIMTVGSSAGAVSTCRDLRLLLPIYMVSLSTALNEPSGWMTVMKT
jgi:hypothetical protein